MQSHPSKLGWLKPVLSKSQSALIKKNEKLQNNKRYPWFASAKERYLGECSNPLILETKMTCNSKGPRVTHGKSKEKGTYWQD